MLDLQLLRDHPERIRQALVDKRAGDPAAVDRAIELDARRRALTTETNETQAAANAASKAIGALIAQGLAGEADAKKAETGALKTRVKELEDEQRTVEAALRQALLELPNLPHESVPVTAPGAPLDNAVVYETEEKPRFDFTPLPHWELLARHGLVDFERGVKVAGAGFPFYVGKGARLQRGLVAFFLDQAEAAGYTEIQPPLVVNEASGVGTGQLPDKEDQMYEATRDGLYLIPTAEVPVTNFHRDEILEEADLPIRYAAYTPCFRREAGSYGKDVRGLNRLHQFDKVEMVQFVRPGESYDALERLRADAERLLRLLELPYRRLLMCTADLGFTQTKKYDLEVWSAGQERWLEVSSISNFEAFQARRANVRFRAMGEKPQFVHTLNGSGLALPRVVAALLENGQQADGSVVLPEALVPFIGFDRIG